MVGFMIRLLESCHPLRTQPFVLVPAAIWAEGAELPLVAALGQAFITNSLHPLARSLQWSRAACPPASPSSSFCSPTNYRSDVYRNLMTYAEHYAAKRLMLHLHCKAMAAAHGSRSCCVHSL